MDFNGSSNLISPAAADRLIAAHDGDTALLCIHALRNGGLDLEKAAADLCRTMSELRIAEEKLLRLGILGSAPAPSPAAAPAAAPLAKLEPADELPEYTAQDVKQRTDSDPNFRLILAEAGKVFGYLLNTNDTKKLFGIYDYLALPPEVILLLLHHCKKIYSGSRLNIRFVEREAYSWVHREISTLEQAEEYIRRYDIRHESVGRVAELFGIRGRELTTAEKRYINTWLDMGLEEAAIGEAFERTMLSTGKLSWNYLDRILANWHNAGIHTLAEAAQKDPRRKAQPAAKPAAVQTSSIDELLNDLNKI